MMEDIAESEYSLLFVNNDICSRNTPSLGVITRAIKMLPRK